MWRPSVVAYSALARPCSPASRTAAVSSWRSCASPTDSRVASQKALLAAISAVTVVTVRKVRCASSRLARSIANATARSDTFDPSVAQRIRLDMGPALSVTQGPRPRHGELVAAADESVAVKSEPEAGHDVEAHHRDQLGAVAQEGGKIGGGAQKEQDQRRQRMERVDVAALDRAQRPLLAEHPHVDRH